MVEFNHVSKIYDTKITSVEDITFKVHKGEFVFLIGPSGSGKTTIIKMLIRDEVPTEGKIFFDDVDITRISRRKVYKLRREIGVIFQDFKLVPDKTAYENVAFAMEAAGRTNKEIRETVPYVLDIVGLSNRIKAFPRQLSGGEQQRVAIARAIANNPKILIADEPTGNLDPASSWDIVQVLTKINNWGTTVIMSTHGTDIVNSLNKRVIQMEKGKIIRDDNKGQYEMINNFEADILNAENSEKRSKQRNKGKKNYKVTLESNNNVEENLQSEEILQEKKQGAFKRFVGRFKRKHITQDSITDVLEKPLNEIYTQPKIPLKLETLNDETKVEIFVEKPEDSEKVESSEESKLNSKSKKEKTKRGIFFDLKQTAEKLKEDENDNFDLKNEVNFNVKKQDEKIVIGEKSRIRSTKRNKDLEESKSNKIEDKTSFEKLSEKDLAALIDKSGEIKVDELNLPKAVIKDLKAAGYKDVNSLLDAGVEKLSQSLLIDPEEIILVSKALKEIMS